MEPEHVDRDHCVILTPVQGIVHTVENDDNNDVQDHEEQEGWQGGEPVRYLVAHVDFNLVGSVDPIYVHPIIPRTEKHSIALCYQCAH